MIVKKCTLQTHVLHVHSTLHIIITICYVTNTIHKVDANCKDKEYKP